MIDYTLKKLTSTHSELRTDVIEGTAPSAPRPGHRFVLFSKALETDKDYRMISTSPVCKFSRVSTATPGCCCTVTRERPPPAATAAATEAQVPE